MMILNHNDAITEDTHLDGTVTPLDALLVINDISLGVVSDESLSIDSEESRQTDVNADRRVTALDALTVLNAISRLPVMQSEASVFGPEQIRGPVSASPNSSAVDKQDHWVRCLEEMNWAREEMLPDFGETAPSAEVDNVISTSLDSSHADTIYAGAGRNETALT
ncbi:MAG: dockerin type I domain-containing protein [Pirellulaceae bacterium]|nr:dockerin type I domain-containing protein [Pirellulaceae bacterium]